MRHPKTGDMITVTGIITATDWDEDDTIVDIRIAAPDEEEYFVGETPEKEELLDLVYQNVKVTGTYEEDEDGGKIIYVEDYEIIEEEDF